MVKVNWTKWVDERPEKEGVYHAYWSDKEIETYTIEGDELCMDEIAVGSYGCTLLYWAENVEPPSAEDED